jgi:hypothetical protein
MMEASVTCSRREMPTVVDHSQGAGQLRPLVREVPNGHICRFIKTCDHIIYLGVANRLREHIGAHRLQESIQQEFVFTEHHKNLSGHFFEVKYRPNRDHELHMSFEKFRIGHHSHEHLRGPLTMANIVYFFCASLAHDILPEGWLIINCHFVETVLPILTPGLFQFWRNVKTTFLAPVLDVQVLVLLRKSVATSVVHPHVIALVNQQEGD